MKIAAYLTKKLTIFQCWTSWQLWGRCSSVCHENVNYHICTRQSTYMLGLCICFGFFSTACSSCCVCIHSGHHAVTSDYEPSDVSYTHSELTITCLPNKFGETSKSDPQNQSSGPCCSGICLSVAVDKLTINFVRQVSNSVYPNFNSQLNSLELFGFLRPPQSLIWSKSSSRSSLWAR